MTCVILFLQYIESETRKKRVEYTAWRDGKVKIDVEGMPPGRCFAEPQRYSIKYLKKIIAAQDQLKFSGNDIQA